jgi:hypothetical protein
VIPKYLLSFDSSTRHTRLHLPYSGSLGQSFPTFPISGTATNLRYYDPLRLPTSLLGLLRFRYRPPIPGVSPLFVRVSCSDSPQRAADHFVKPGAFIDRHTMAGFLSQDLIGSPEFPSYPCKRMPCSLTPAVSQQLAMALLRLLLSGTHPNRPLSHPSMVIQ